MGFHQFRPALLICAFAFLWGKAGSAEISEISESPTTPANKAPSSLAGGRQTVVVTNVNTSFKQSGPSCVLSSYAIVANYFTRRPVTDYFESYCRRFGIFYVTPLQAEARYAAHFDGEFQRRKCHGIQVILDLHSNSTEKPFVEARQKFNAEFFTTSANRIAELEGALKRGESFLTMGVRYPADVHAVTVFYDGARFQVRDTGLRGLYSIQGLADLGDIVDCVLYTRR